MRDILSYDRRMRDVRRYAGIKMRQPTNLAEHGALTALIFYELAREADIPVQAKHMVWVMRHDIVETVTGDMLYPAKNASPEVARKWAEIEEEVVATLHKPLKPYTDEMAEKVLGPELYPLWKMADYIEGAVTLIEEQIMGNDHPKVREALANYKLAIGKLIRSMNDKELKETMQKFLHHFIQEPTKWTFV